MRDATLTKAMELVAHTKALASRYRVNGSAPPGGDMARMLEELAEAISKVIRAHSRQAEASLQELEGLRARIEILERRAAAGD